MGGIGSLGRLSNHPHYADHNRPRRPDLCPSPTTEVVITDYAKNQVNLEAVTGVLFQQHTKFRDEIRPRFGLMRVKEFIMMDAYSFHADEACLDQTYQDMSAAYHRIFKRCGLEAYAVEADTGAIGGTGSHEFMVAAEVGEDAILYSEESGYAANVETAETTLATAPAWNAPAKLEVVSTPAGTIDEVVAFLQANGYPDVVPAHGKNGAHGRRNQRWLVQRCRRHPR